MSELATVNTTCCSCGKDIRMDKVDIEGMHAFKLERFLPKNIRCMRCADYIRRTRIVKAAIHMNCMKLLIYARKTESTAEAARAKAKAELEPLLKKFLTVTCSFYRIPAYWDDALLEAVLSDPSNYGLCLRNCVLDAKNRKGQG